MTIRWPRLLNPTILSQIIKAEKNPLTALKIFNEAKLKYPNYRHNGPVYATMINLLGDSGQISEMKKVIDQMKMDSCECKDSVFATAIKTYSNAGLFDEAISLFKSLRQFNCVQWTHSFNTLLDVTVKESKLEAAHDLFLESSHGWEVKSRIRCLNILMDVLCHHGRSDLALHILQEMNYQYCQPDWETYKIMMKGLCNDGRLNDATHLLYSMFWRISQKGSGEDVVIYKTLLDALCDNGQVQEAVEILLKILKKGLKAPKRFRQFPDLQFCDSTEDILRIKALISDILIRGGVPSLASYSAMAVDFYREGKIREGNQVICQMEERGFKPSAKMFEAKADALCREGRIDELAEVIQQMVELNCVPTLKVYNSVVRGLCNTGKSVQAMAYLGKMSRQVGCVADKETYSVLIYGLCREGKYVDAGHMLEEMLNKSFRPCAESYDILIRGLCLAGKQYEGVMLLEEMLIQGELPEFATWKSLISNMYLSPPPDLPI